MLTFAYTFSQSHSQESDKISLEACISKHSAHELWGASSAVAGVHPFSLYCKHLVKEKRSSDLIKSLGRSRLYSRRTWQCQAWGGRSQKCRCAKGSHAHKFHISAKISSVVLASQLCGGKSDLPGLSPRAAESVPWGTRGQRLLGSPEQQGWVSPSLTCPHPQQAAACGTSVP